MCDSPAPAPNPRDFAVVVGIEDYKDAALGALSGAKRDASEFSDWLCDPSGGGLPCSHVETILSSVDGGDCKPAAFRVRNSFIRLLEAANLEEEPIGRRLYIFFAGHGAGNPDRIDEVGLLPAPYSDLQAWYVVGLHYVQEFQRLGAFEEIFLFMDCCRDELPRHPLSFPLAVSLRNDPNARSVRLFIGYATEHNSKARERTFEDNEVHGVFSYSLLEALKDDQTWVGGELTAQRLATYVAARVLHHRPAGSRQVAKFPLSPDGIVVLSRDDQLTSKTRVRVRLPDPAAELEVYWGGDLENALAVQTTQPTPGTVEFELDSGRLYLLGVPRGNGELHPASRRRIDGEEVTIELR
ncbi:MAG: caspase family protein [Myxococcota bacterium]